MQAQNKQAISTKSKKSRWFWLGLALTLLALPAIAFSIYINIWKYLHPTTDFFVYIYFFSYLGYLPFTLGICFMTWGIYKKRQLTNNPNPNQTQTQN